MPPALSSSSSTQASRPPYQSFQHLPQVSTTILSPHDSPIMTHPLTQQTRIKPQAGPAVLSSTVIPSSTPLTHHNPPCPPARPVSSEIRLRQRKEGECWLRSQTPAFPWLHVPSVKWGLRQHTDHRNEETHRKRLVQLMAHNKGLISISGCCYHHRNFQAIPCSNPPHGKPCSAIWSSPFSLPDCSVPHQSPRAILLQFTLLCASVPFDPSFPS